ncbi:hypothetical protein [Agriterribacter sp.]|uniref:hypothetical protein n=1 Tax=Agriterribacter sp. TaxID=2821509 RepID=UPI002CD594ED|nr:hypothetical protein [Agriterribacter sp.]HRP56477.1 hypothetical protein [Agriterribacter sp.]
MNVLRKLVFTFLICFLVNIVFSQQQYYIYIQSEDQQEFYVRTGSEIFNSSGNGYLVIPGLQKNTHEIIVGFPGKKEPEWRFNCTINEADLGFVLKAEGSDGLHLLSLKHEEEMKGTAVARHPEVKENNVVPPPGVISNDPFSSMLAEAVNDPTIRRQLVIVEKEAAPAVAVSDDPSKAIHGSTVPEQKPVDEDTDKDKDKVALATLPQAAPVAAITEDEKPASFAVKKTGKTNSVQSGKSSKAGAAEKSENILTATAEKKYEPFVVKEIHEPENAKTVESSISETEKEEDNAVTEPLKAPEPFVVKETKNDIPQTTSSVKSGTEKNTINNEDTKYLPFVITPGDKGNSNENRTAGSEAVTEKNKAPLVVKKEDKVPAVEKEKPGLPGSAKEDRDPTGISKNEKRTPAGKKAILSSIRKTLERKSRDGTDLIYIDENLNGAKDTIRIFVPVVP